MAPAAPAADPPRYALAPLERGRIGGGTRPRRGAVAANVRPAPGWRAAALPVRHAARARTNRLVAVRLRPLPYAGDHDPGGNGGPQPDLRHRLPTRALPLPLRRAPRPGLPAHQTGSLDGDHANALRHRR